MLDVTRHSYQHFHGYLDIPSITHKTHTQTPTIIFFTSFSDAGPSSISSSGSYSQMLDIPDIVTHQIHIDILADR